MTNLKRNEQRDTFSCTQSHPHNKLYCSITSSEELQKGNFLSEYSSSKTFGNYKERACERDSLRPPPSEYSLNNKFGTENPSKASRERRRMLSIVNIRGLQREVKKQSHERYCSVRSVFTVKHQC